tara:strand:+ start:871 stop:1017 length:147 start_codon:yes stop_codon:yes gene_type:complete
MNFEQEKKEFLIIDSITADKLSIFSLEKPSVSLASFCSFYRVLLSFPE